MTLWRIQTRPYGGEWPWERVWDYCVQEGVVGLGWQVDGAPQSLAEYERLYQVAHEGDSAGIGNVRRLTEVVPGNFIWTRDPYGLYWLGQATGTWEYRHTEASRKADIANVVPVNLVQVGTNADVPGKVIASFRARRTFQRIISDPSRLFSEAIFSALTEGTPIPRGIAEDVFDLIDAENVEDILFIKLQVEGWVVLPEGRKADTMAYEFVAKRPSDGTLGIIQVKTGHSPVDLDALSKAASHGSISVAYAFQPNGHYVGAVGPKIEIIPRTSVITFMRANRQLLPAPVRVWMDFTGL